MTRSDSRSRNRSAPNHDERENAMATFLNGMDARALLYMFSQINDRPLDSLKGKSVDQIKMSMMFQGEVDIDFADPQGRDPQES